MRKRRPPFALVLSTLVAGAALAIAIAGIGSSHQSTTRPPTIGIGPAGTCVTTSAEALADDRSAIVITASAQAPVNVTEQASGPKGIATVTRGEVVTARARADQPVEVKRTAFARARACARGDSATAARAIALRRAFERALALAHMTASREAGQSLEGLLQREYRTVVATAQSAAAERAHRLAVAAEVALAAQAQALARTRAGE
jgi:hypothetical protein